MVNNPQIAFVVLAALLCLPGGCRHGGQQAPATRPAEDPPTEKVQIIEQRWPNGKLRLLKEVARDSDGEPVNHGTYTRWYDNGQKEYEAIFVMGKKDGIVTRWHRSGRMWMEEHYVDGRKHGTTSTWDDSGTMRKQENYLNGQPHGTWTAWGGSGRIKWRKNFDHGRPLP